METFPKLPQMDIIFVRNVLIYFSLETKQIIFAQMRKNMKPDGYLFLGGSETTLNIDANFERYVTDKATCYRLKDAQPKAV